MNVNNESNQWESIIWNENENNEMKENISVMAKI